MAINLGDVNFNLGANTASLQSSLNILQRFGSTVDSVQTGLTSSAAGVAAAFRKQEAAITSALNKTIALSNAMSSVRGGQQYANQASAAFQKLNSVMTSGQLSASQYQRAMLQFTTSMNNAKTGFNQFAKSADDAGGKGKVLHGVIQGLSSSAVILQGPLGGIATRVNNLGQFFDSTAGKISAFVAGAAAAGYTVYKLGEQVFDAGVKMNKLVTQFEAIDGVTGAANTEIEKLFNMARQTGQSMDDIAAPFAKFEIAAKGAGISAQETYKEFAILASAATKLQLSGEEAQGMFKALEQMLSKGTVQAEELRGQLGDRLAGAFNIAAKAMGVTTAELGKMMKNGEILSNDFLPKFTNELAKVLHIDLSKPIDNWTASINNFKTAWFQLMSDIEKRTRLLQNTSNEIKTLTGYIDEYRQYLDSAKGSQAQFVDYMGVLSDYVKTLGVGLGDMQQKLQSMNFSDLLPQGLVTDSDKKDFNDFINFMVNGAATIGTIFNSIPGIVEGAIIGAVNAVGNAVDDMMVYVTKKIADMKNSLLGEHGSFMNDLVGVLGDALGNAFDLGDLGKKWTEESKGMQKTWVDVPNAYADAWQKASEDIHKIWQSDIDWAQKWTDAANDRVAATAGGGPQKRFRNHPPSYYTDQSLPANDNVLSDKQQRALDKKTQAIKDMEDEIDRANEKLSALGGSDGTLNALNEKFADDKTVEKYAKELRKAGVDTEYITQKTAELHQILDDTRQAEHAREAMLQLRDAFTQGFDEVSDSILSAFESGENAAEAFKKAALKAINEILDEIIKLTLLNPLKNFLFGTDLRTSDDLPGGFLKNILPGIFGKPSGTSGGSTASNVGAMLPMNTTGSSTYVMSSVNDNTASTLSGAMDNWAKSIKQIESGSFSGNYGAIGNLTDSGDRAYGAYQVMGSNIPSWTKGALGTSMTPQQFLKDPSAQDSVFAKYFGGAADKYGPSGAANWWFTGSQHGNGTDVNGMSNSKYTQMFNNNMQKLGTTAGDAAKPIDGLGGASQNALNGLDSMGKAFDSFSLAGGQLNGGFNLSQLMGMSSSMLDTNFGSMFSDSYLFGSGSSWDIGGWAKGGVFSGGNPIARFSKGDVFGSPHIFPYANGNKMGMLGEAGEEAVMPLGRDSSGRLGVRNHGGGGGDVNVSIYDRAGVRFNTRKRHNSDGTIDLVGIIDQTVADRLTRKGTDTNKAYQNNWGLPPKLKAR